MATVETYSKRLKRIEESGQQDVYEYGLIPTALRVQIIHIWDDAVGPWDRYYDTKSNNIWRSINQLIAKEHGLFALGENFDNPAIQCKKYLMSAGTLEALDIIEFSFRLIDNYARRLNGQERHDSSITQSPDDAIDDLNTRFQEHSVGYQYMEGIIIRIDSQFTHAELVKPALSLLNAEGFKGPAEEFLSAFDHYRRGETKDAMSNGLKAFESTMKSICVAKKWHHDPHATAKPLIDKLVEKGLIPAEMLGHFGALRAAMESGLPTIANKNSRHGQGLDLKSVPPHFAAYALHLAASNIIFLVKAFEAQK